MEFEIEVTEEDEAADELIAQNPEFPISVRRHQMVLTSESRIL